VSGEPFSGMRGRKCGGSFRTSRPPRDVRKSPLERSRGWLHRPRWIDRAA